MSGIAEALRQMACEDPRRPAILYPAGRSHQGRLRHEQLSFRQLDRLVDRYAHGLHAEGIGPGQRTLVLLRPGIELIAIMFALFRMGAVPVLIDPGMGLRAFLQCVRETEAENMVAIGLAHILRRVQPRAFVHLKRAIRLDSAASLRALQGPDRPFDDIELPDQAPAGVFFTSGSTGVPKGVIYTRSLMQAQLALLRAQLHVETHEVHLAVFYAFALFNPALGATTVIPAMNPRQPAKAEPAVLLEAIETFGVTLSMGSPVVWQRVGAYCHTQQRDLGGMSKLMLFGAPIFPDLVELLAPLLPENGLMTPYGATEALPVSCIGGTALQHCAPQTDTGAGVCVGAPLEGIEVGIIPLEDQPLSDLAQSRLLAAGEVGEIIVRGPIVTPAYLHRPQHTARAHLPDGAQGAWHRMGDAGYLDAQGRLWCLGRQSHGVHTLDGIVWSVAAEAILQRHPTVSRCALVGVGPRGAQQALIVVEGREYDPALARELLQRLHDHAATRAVRRVLFHPNAFPVDVRHNAKILRERLVPWAERQLRRQV